MQFAFINGFAHGATGVPVSDRGFPKEYEAGFKAGLEWHNVSRRMEDVQPAALAAWNERQ